MNHIQVAILEIGKQEIPKNSNWGPDIHKYLKSVNVTFPASWCAAFVYWCVTQENPNTILHQTAGVLDMWNHTDSKYKHTTPMAGDIFIMDFGQGHGHTGFVESVEGDIIHTIEGNSNNDGSREGYEVCRKPGGRHVGTIKGFIRLS